MSIERVREEEIKAEAGVSFYIAATGPETRVRRTLKHGDTFLVIDAHGDIGAAAGTSDGLFHRDTRFLSQLELRVNGMQPLLLGSNMREDNAIFTADLTNPDMFSMERVVVLEKDTLHINRSVFVWHDTLFQRLSLRNHGAKRVELLISIAFSADFADVFEVRGMRRARRGTFNTRLNGPHEALLNYLGLDDFLRITSVYFDPVPTRLTEREARYQVTLTAHETMSFCVAVRCNPNAPQPAPFVRSLLYAHRELRQAAQGAAVVQTSNPLFDKILRRSMADLAMLKTQTPQGPYPYAGTPWYSTTFGRDGLITALRMLWVDPRIARGVLFRLAALRATTTDAPSDAEPGKILHEMRYGEMAALGEVPFGLYYGSVDSTPLFVMLSGAYYERTGDRMFIESFWAHVEAALAWFDNYGDKDGDGFVEYSRRSANGLAQQGWKDSSDSVFHADGRLAEAPIALCEVQGYVYAARHCAAQLAAMVGRTEQAAALESQATALQTKFEEAFWCSDIGMYAIALDGQKRQCRVRTSNAGHCLYTRVAKPEHAPLVAQGLLGPDFFSGWGVRTVGAKEVRYNPISYHNGSVWPHDNALIASGLSKYGVKDLASRILSGLLDASVYVDLHRLPELFCGLHRRAGEGPTLYPVACSPQAWAAASVFLLLQACLGISIDGNRKQVVLDAPYLPENITELWIKGLEVKGSRVDLFLERSTDVVRVHVLDNQGKVDA